MDPTKDDAVHAYQIARGFGVHKSNIIHLNGMILSQVNDTFNRLKKMYRALAKEGKRSLLLVYCAGHGVADQQQYMVLNTTSGNLLNIEQTCRDVVSLSKDKNKNMMTTAFAIYDMCKD